VGERPPAPRLVLEGEGTRHRVFVAWRRLLVLEPRGVDAVVRSLVMEGRRFAQTEEGRAWLEVLARLDWVRSARNLWDAHPPALDAPDTDMTPSDWLHALVDALTPDGVEAGPR
jgi:hypothetical protein